MIIIVGFSRPGSDVPYVADALNKEAFKARQHFKGSISEKENIIELASFTLS